MWTLVYLWSQEGKCPDTRKPRPVCPHQTGQATRRLETPMVVTVSSTDPRSVKALALLPRARTWTHGTRKCDGRPFLIAPGRPPPRRSAPAPPASAQTHTSAVRDRNSCVRRLTYGLFQDLPRNFLLF